MERPTAALDTHRKLAGIFAHTAPSRGLDGYGSQIGLHIRVGFEVGPTIARRGKGHEERHRLDAELEITVPFVFADGGEIPEEKEEKRVTSSYVI